MQHYMVLHAGGDTIVSAMKNFEDILTGHQGWWPIGGPAVFVLDGHINLIQVIYRADDVPVPSGLMSADEVRRQEGL